MVAERTFTEVSGAVIRVNDHGFLIAGREGWLNLSRFATPTPALPAVGQLVSAALDKSGFVRNLAVLDAATPQPASAPAPGAPPSKDVQIARMNALAHAVAILTTHGDAVRYDDVIVVAEALEAWITR